MILFRYVVIVIMCLFIKKCVLFKLQLRAYSYYDIAIHKSDSPYLEELPYEIYLVKLYIGSPSQIITASISNSQPFSFRLTKYSWMMSSSFNYSPLIKLSTSYQNEIVSGFYFNETIPSLTNDNLTIKFDLLYVQFYKEEKIALNPNIHFVLSFPKVSQENYSNKCFDIIDCLYDNNIINNKKIGITFNKNNPMLYIGEDFLNGNYPKCFDIEDNDKKNKKTRWTCQFSIIKYGDAIIYPYTEFLFDIEQSLITVPMVHGKKIFDTIVTQTFGYCRQVLQMTCIILVCDPKVNIEKLNDIEFYYSHYNNNDNKNYYKTFVLKWKDLFEWDDNKQLHISKLIISRIGLISWVIGMPALKGNIIIFDKEDNSIGFVDLYTHSEYLNDKKNINSNSSSSMIYNINISIIVLCLLGILLQIKHKLSLTYIK